MIFDGLRDSSWNDIGMPLFDDTRLSVAYGLIKQMQQDFDGTFTEQGNI